MMSKSVYLLAIFFLAFQGRIFGATEEDSRNAIEDSVYSGCGLCDPSRCDAVGNCLFGIAIDPCGCCIAGICAKVTGEACWNDSIPQLPKKAKLSGVCGKFYSCQLRTALLVEEEPEAICECEMQIPVCGSNKKTYPNHCIVYEKAVRQNNPSLKVIWFGNCLSAPWIVTPFENVYERFGKSIALHCVARGIPVPHIIWQFQSANGQKVLNLPSAEHAALVDESAGLMGLMQRSQLQLARLDERHVGTYRCIAINSIGNASAAISVSLI